MIPLDKPQIVILSSIDWGQAWQRHQIFASQWAAAGHEVFFVENTGFRNPGFSDWSRLLPTPGGPFRAAPERVRVISPGVLPPNGKLFRGLNSAWLAPRLRRRLETLGLKPRPIVVCYFATATTLELIRRLDPSVLIYDCASNFRAHARAPDDFPELEKRLLAQAHLVACDSDFLYRQKLAEHGRVIQIHQGVDEEFFKTAPPSGFKRCLYYGTWSADLDPAYIERLAQEGFEVSVMGPVKEPAPELSPSIRRLPGVSPAELPRRLETFDVFLMPYRLTPFLEGVLPAKTYECLAMGRPTLATPLPSLKPFHDVVELAQSPEAWARIAQDLPAAENSQRREARINRARSHTQKAEFERLDQAVQNLWNKKT